MGLAEELGKGGFEPVVIYYYPRWGMGSIYIGVFTL